MNAALASSGNSGGGNGRWRPPAALLTPDEFGGKGSRKLLHILRKSRAHYLN